MLSRVADALFWTGRYLERASFLARAVDVTFHLDLDLHGAAADGASDEWDALLAMTQQAALPDGARDGGHGRVPHWMLLDPANPGSLMACINRARNNARMIRGHLSSPMWRELNKLYWHLSDPDFQARVVESPHDFCDAAQVGVMLCHGICADTVTCDEGWQFLEMGTFLERGEKVLRVLESRFGAEHSGADLPVSALRWGAVLKKCRAYEAYQRLFISRVEPQRVVEFLLFHPDFPHSVRFSLDRVSGALSRIGGIPPERSESESARTVGSLVGALTYPDREALVGPRLHSFLGDSLVRLATIGRLLQRQYSLA